MGDLEPITSINQSEVDSQDGNAGDRESAGGGKYFSSGREDNTRLRQLRMLMRKSRRPPAFTRNKRAPVGSLERIYSSTRKV